MTIATKNGSVILKDGSVAQNCGCCGICEPFIAISVIDEDDGYSPARRRDDDWNCFRTAFPSSPFFLLVPKRSDNFGVQLPAAWDGQKYDVSRDNGIVANATDYYSLLGLESLLAQYDRIVLVVDNSGSMSSGTVQASLDMLYSQLESQHGINEANGSLVRINFFSENWIDPFANICKTPSGATGACCGLTCSVKPQCQCNAAAGEVFRGVGTVCSPNPCVKCAQWFSDLPPTMQVELTNCQDNAYGTDFATMNGVYTVTKGEPIQLQLNILVWRVTYEYSFPTQEKIVQVLVDCFDSGLKVRYFAFARTQFIYGAQGSGTTRFAPPGCYSESFPGGNVAFLSCNFSVTCNPLP